MVLSAKCGGQIGTQSLLKAVIEGLSQAERKCQVNFGRRQKRALLLTFATIGKSKAKRSVPLCGFIETKKFI